MIDLNIVEGHAPADWQTQATSEQIRHFLEAPQAMTMIVMCADIRLSTVLMKEATDFRYFAQIIGHFINSVSAVIRGRRGWFDKFTGDGFLAYWITAERSDESYFEEVLNTSRAIVEAFRTTVVPALRYNARNFPSGIGISIGLDSGPTYLADIAGDLTIVGPPVVGAVRMVSAAAPYEILANVFLAERLLRQGDNLKPAGLTMTRTMRPSKEYPSGQEVCLVHFTDEKAAGAEPA
jgi:class 3 adenylate cyclase